METGIAFIMPPNPDKKLWLELFEAHKQRKRDRFKILSKLHRKKRFVKDTGIRPWWTK